MDAALRAFLEHLDAGDGVPLVWALAHRPGGDLHRLWSACDEPGVLALAVLAAGGVFAAACGG